MVTITSDGDHYSRTFLLSLILSRGTTKLIQTEAAFINDAYANKIILEIVSIKSVRTNDTQQTPFRDHYRSSVI